MQHPLTDSLSGMLDELCDDASDKFSIKQADFLSSLLQQRQATIWADIPMTLSDKQKKWLEDLWDKVFGDGPDEGDGPDDWYGGGN